ncbi:MAG: ribonuclease Z, partial [Bacteroidota bacterium]
MRQKFELLVLGTGSALPTNNRNPSAQLLNIAERFFLIDCGEGTQVQLRKYKASFSRINHIFISHLHGDHYFGLIGLLQSFHLLGRKQKLNIFCPPQLKQIIEIQNNVSGTDLHYKIEFHFTQTQSLQKIFEDNKTEVFSFPLSHKIPCTGFLFREKQLPRNIIKEKLDLYNISISEIHKLKAGFDATDVDGNIIPLSELTSEPAKPRSFAYCSDTQYSEDIVAYIKNVDLV